MTTLDFSNGFGAVWDLIRDANSYIEDQQPWALNKAGDTAATAAVLGDCLEALRVVALLVVAADPARVGGAVATTRPSRSPVPTSGCPTPRQWGLLPAGSPLEKGAPLFPRIET